jgi:hypothetical protein
MPDNLHSSFSRRSWSALALAALLASPACAEPEPEPEPFAGTYIARVGETLIAIVVDDPAGLAVGYACDGRDGAGPATYAWFGGTLADGAAVLVGARGELTVEVADGAATGELMLTGADTQAYDAPRSTSGALLWGSLPPADGDVLGGWIFADDGTQRGAVLKRNTGDVGAFLLTSQTTTTASFEGLTISVKTMTSPTLVE